MKSSNTPRKFILAKICAILIFSAALIYTSIWIASRWYELLISIKSESAQIIINLGAFYLIGIVVLAACLLYMLIYITLKNRSLPEKHTKGVIFILMAGIVLMIFLPKHVGKYYVKQLELKQYHYCEKASYQWLFYKELAFTSSEDECPK